MRIGEDKYSVHCPISNQRNQWNIKLSAHTNFCRMIAFMNTIVRMRKSVNAILRLREKN